MEAPYWEEHDSRACEKEKKRGNEKKQRVPQVRARPLGANLGVAEEEGHDFIRCREVVRNASAL